MLFKVLDRFMVKTAQGEQEINSGQIVKLDEVKAQGLIEKGKIIPCETLESQGKPQLPKYVIIYSRLLDDFLLIAATDKDRNTLKKSGIEDVIYTREEIGRLDGLPPESLQAHHLIKKTYPHSVIEKG